MSDARRPLGPGDGWVDCRCGARHWGLLGAAGLLLSDGERVALQHRAPWSHHGGTWALPGGALHVGEDPVTGALREAEEEAGIEPASVHVAATSVLHHPDWSYTSVVAHAAPGTRVAATDAESVEVVWVPFADVTERPLLPAFAEAWPDLRSMLDGDPAVVVDSANVVGSRPDGWWRDRLGAAERLVTRLDALAAHGVPATMLGLPGETWWPAWEVVTEGEARAAGGTARVQASAAAGAGDDAIVASAQAHVAAGRAPVFVVTADRELGARVEQRGARRLRPSALLQALDAV